MGGSVLAEILLGSIVDKYGWDGGFMLLVMASILSVVFLAFTLYVHDTSENEIDDGNLAS